MTQHRQADNALKGMYREIVAEKLNNIDPLISMIKKTCEDVWGKDIIKLIDRETSIKATLKNLYCGFEIADKILRGLTISAFVNYLNSEIDELLRNSIIYYSRLIALMLRCLLTRKKVYDLDRDVSEKLTANIFESNKKVDYMLIQEIVDTLDSNINIIYCSTEFRQEYQKNMIEQKQNIDILVLEHGYKALSWNGIPIFANPHIKGKTAYFLDASTFSINQLCDWKWLENENGQVLRQMPNKPSYQVTLVKYANLICNNLSKNGVYRFNKE